MKAVSTGTVTMQYHKNFRLFLSTKLSKPSMSPEVVAALTVVNFTVTLHGLQDLLRKILVQKERSA